jgi:hypothetical protein
VWFPRPALSDGRHNFLLAGPHLADERLIAGLFAGETFWAARFGMLVDRFGIPWMINCEKTA